MQIFFLILQLSLNGVEIGEENTVGDTEFLMEVMETNEKLSEVKTSKDLDDIRKINNGIASTF